ncbi:MAG TPA: DUF3570 domain-containing protein [Cyclobacteriaceae bacterium]|nr:DUF3570 domain-containing protein [Cyclobacteriaceae bacterium]
MKKRYLLIGLIAATLGARSQSLNPNYKKKKLSHNDVQMVYSYYNQNNNHSAVTGGIGTEDLQVYSTQFLLDNIKDSTRAVHFGLGLDVISSASTDNIDFIFSSASRHDSRIYTSLGYNRTSNPELSWGTTSSFSMESDYLSLGQAFSLNHINALQTRELSATLQMYFDDLRWGRYQGHKVLELVYPSELRGRNWFDRYRRNSFNLSLGWYQTINQRMSLGVYPGLTYQSGLLSTPFHRVYFTDGSKKVESLPFHRVKIPLGVQLNSFVGTRWILRSYYRVYWDDFGITAHTFNQEAAVKVSRVITLTPFVRLYVQQGTDFFRPYNEHDPDAQYYTSDYDLSDFNSMDVGMGFRYAPYAVKGRTTFKAIEFRFSHYQRSDGLHANVVSMSINYDRESKSNQR